MPHANVIARVWRESELREAQDKPHLVDRLGQRITDNYNQLVLAQGGILAFASTQPKKIDDAKTVFSGTSARMTVLDPIEVLHWFQSADEKSGTFIGNAYEKAEHILNRIYGTLGYDKVVTRLKERGYDPSRVVFCVNDCGAYFNTDYSEEPEFARSRHERAKFGPWPGVEFSPVTDAQGGQIRFFSDLKAMKTRKEIAGETVDMTGRDHQTYLMFKLEPRRENVRLHSFEAAVPIDFTTKPAPANDDVLTSFHFSKATDSSLPEHAQGLTRAEFSTPYLQHYSAESRALNEMIRIARVPMQYTETFSAQVPGHTNQFYVASHLNVLPANEMSFTTVPDGIRVESRTYDTTKNGAYQQLTSNANAVLLGGHTAKLTSNWDNHFLDLFDLWSSLIVDKQVRVETFQGKPFIVLNRKNAFTHNGQQNGDLDWDNPDVEKHFFDFMKNIDPKEDPWLQLVLFTRYLHEKGFVKQEPRFLHTVFEPNDPALAEFLRESFREAHGKGQFIPEYEPETYGQDEIDLFEVTMLGSASTRVSRYTEDAFELGSWVIEQGWHARVGGGRYGVMGHFAEGALRSLEKMNPLWAHFSAIQMPRTLQFEGVCLDPLALRQETERNNGLSNKFLLVATGFDQRIRSLARSQALVAMAAGMGTYQEIVRICRLKEAGDPAFAGKKIILVNQKQPGSDTGVFDLFLNILPQRYIDEHLDVVPDIATAKREILKKHEDFLGTHHYSAFEP